MDHSLHHLTHDNYTVACICAPGIELAPVQAMLDERHPSLPTSSDDQISYKFGRMGAHNVVIAVMPETGKNKAATVVTQLLNDFGSTRFGLLVGIGSGIPGGEDDIRLGDVVVSKPTETSGGVVQFDGGNIHSNGQFERTGTLGKPPPALQEIVESLEVKQKSTGNQISKYLTEMLEKFPNMGDEGYIYPVMEDEAACSHEGGNTCRLRDHSKIIERAPPKIHYGTIGSSNVAIEDGITRKRLKEELGILCVEMEAAGLMDEFPCLVIRGICDFADSHKCKSWQPYAAATAAAYAKELLSVIPSEQIDKTTKAVDALRDAQSEKIVEAVQKATKVFKLCPNRIWAVARSLPQWEQKLPPLLSFNEEIKQMTEHKEHDQCTFDFCEVSRRNFTSVEQRHESPSCKDDPCKLLQDCFPRDTLGKAANNESPTAWKLDGTAMIERPQQFMAISHVWSDGTGTGAWPEGKINICLYAFFKGIAEQFQCKGIWWDTICIPKEKAARSMAINKIQSNYEDARITLVHDCYLRNWEWVDAETACFAIIMSPWFSRGWTSLELAKSQKVKVVFKGTHGPLIKDLDEDILAKAKDSSERHQIASDAIAKLRGKRIIEVNDLLTILGPRHTSWPRDLAIISGLLVGVKISSEDSQQDIYQKILRKIGTVYHGHLFHNLPTMSKGFSWCSTSLLDLPLVSPGATLPLRIGKNGEVVGTWKVFCLDSIPKEQYIWKGTHPFIEAKLRLAWTNKDKHVLLVEPDARSINRALLAKVVRNTEKALTSVHCQLIGSVYFHPQGFDQKNKGCIELELSIGDTEGIVEIIGKAWDYLSEAKEVIANAEPNNFNDQESNTPIPESENDRNLALLLAAANGDVGKVELLLNMGAKPDFQDEYMWTALHYATWRGHNRVVQLLIEGPNQNLHSKFISKKDGLGQQPLHLAAERGNKEIVELLLNGADPKVLYEDDEQTVLHHAAWGGSEVVVNLLLEKDDPTYDPDARDKEQRTALHIAAEKGYTSVVKLLLAHKASINAKDKYEGTALYWAVSEGHNAVVELLLENGANVNIGRKDGATPLAVAIEHSSQHIVKLLLEKRAKVNYGYLVPPLGERRQRRLQLDLQLDSLERLISHQREEEERRRPRSVFHNPLRGQPAPYRGHADVDRLLKESRQLREELRRLLEERRTPLSRAAEIGNTAVVELLLAEKDVDVNLKDEEDLTPRMRAKTRGHNAVVNLLVKKGAVG